MAWMDNYRAGLSHQQQLRMFNQLDSHDTARFKSLLGKDVARLPLAVVWLFTRLACPVFTTVTKWGWTGTTIRFVANRSRGSLKNRTLLCWRCISGWQNYATRIRRCATVVAVIYAEDNVVVFVRVLNRQRVLVAINRGHACEVVLPASPLLSVSQWQHKEGNGMLADDILTLPAISASVWIGH